MTAYDFEWAWKRNLHPSFSIETDSYGGRVADLWWEKNRITLERLHNLTVVNLPLEGSRALAQLAQPGMELSCTIQEGQVWIGEEASSAHLELIPLKVSSARSRP